MALNDTTPHVEVTYEMLAGKSRRLFNYVIDFFAMYIIIFILAMLAAFIAVAFELDDMLIWMQSEISPLQSYSIAICLLILYFGICETLSSRTLGKLITGTKVVMADTGAKPTSDVILRRTLCRLIPFEAFSFLGEYSKGWHDSISGTAVVNAKKYREAVNLQRSFEELGKQQDIA